MCEETNSDPLLTGPAPSIQGYFRYQSNKLQKRIAEIEGSNAEMELVIEEKRRAVQQMRLERALLFEQIGKYDSAFKGSDQGYEDSRGSPSLGPGDKGIDGSPGSRPNGQGPHGNQSSGSEYKDSEDSLSPPTTVEGEEAPQVVALDEEKKEGKVSVEA